MTTRPKAEGQAPPSDPAVLPPDTDAEIKPADLDPETDVRLVPADVWTNSVQFADTDGNIIVVTRPERGNQGYVLRDKAATTLIRTALRQGIVLVKENLS